MSDQHIILLPRSNYWDWVQAVRDYAVRFQVNLTPRATNARDFNFPDQTVTIVNVPGGYPDEGDILQWFASNAAEVALDVLDVDTPDRLRTTLAERISQGLRFGQEEVPPPAPPPIPPGEFRLLWPTEYNYVTQDFAENPDLYSGWGLPGHEGIDFHAPEDSKIFAGADGTVYEVSDGWRRRNGQIVRDSQGNPVAHPYGIHVRIDHGNDYRTIYAHLNKALVQVNDVVRGGQVIGLANSTGNSTGHHLHLTLKKEGATQRGETPFPYDIVDPRPFLMTFEESALTDEMAAMDARPTQKALVGVHAPLEGVMTGADWEAVKTAKIEAL